MYHVIIIGAGPAGTAAGHDLAQAGFRVLILDRHQFPRKKACAGGITPKALNLFAYDISHLILRSCQRVRICRPGGKYFTISGKAPLCHMVRRKDLDLFSLNQARAAGAEFQTIDRLVAMDQDAGSVRIQVRANGRENGFSARYLIGADGANSRVRQLLPALSGNRVRKLPALEADVYVGHARTIPMTFDFSHPFPGYYWIFPRQDHVNIGIFAARPGLAVDQAHLAAYAAKHLGTDRLEAVRGYPIGVPAKGGGQFGQGRVLLAGDAAGLAEPLLGEGIYSALASGRLAARALCQALDQGSGLSLYQHSLARLKADLWFCRAAARAMYCFPGPSLSVLPFCHRLFSQGYAAGKSVSQIILPF